MDTDRSTFCGCKGVRTCLKCEVHFNIQKPKQQLPKDCYTYCVDCSAAFHGSESHPNHNIDQRIPFPGVCILPEFITKEEEQFLINSLDTIPWDASQSGRRKQNFGPKCNFKKMRLQLGDFRGFPECTRFVQDRFTSVKLLKDYRTIEQCSLEYDPKNGASIDPHIDDCWIWGERIITLNLMSDSVLSLVPYHGGHKRYNLELAPEQYRNTILEGQDNIAVRVPMPRRSLLVLYGDARYCWEHMILREDIVDRRVCLAYREFTTPYLPGGASYSKSQQVYDMANNFF